MSTATYTVVGMTWGHCAESVTEAGNTVGGVTHVSVAVDVAAVRAAVEKAGYAVTAS